MSNQPVADAQQGFAGGLNTTSDPQYLQPNQVRQLTNFRLNSYGAATKRNGSQYVNSSALPTACSTGFYWPSLGKAILGTSSSAVYKISSSINSAPTSLGSVSKTYTSDIKLFSTGTADAAYIAVSSGVPYTTGVSTALYRTDGTTLTGIAGVIAVVTDLVVYNQRLWGWNSGISNALYYSDLANATSSIGGDSLGVGASGGGQINILTSASSPIIACATIGASLLIFHQRGVSRLTGFGQSDVTTAPQSMASDVGIWSRTAIDVYNGVGYFVTPRGLYVATEGSVGPVGTPERPDPLIPLLAMLTSAPNVGGDSIRVKFNRATQEVWISVDGYGIYIYNTILQCWGGLFKFWADGYTTVSAMFEILGAGGESHIWLGQSTSLLQTDLTADIDETATYLDAVTAAGTGGTNVTATVQCHRMFAQTPAVAKSWRWVNTNANLTPYGTPPTVRTNTALYPTTGLITNTGVSIITSGGASLVTGYAGDVQTFTNLIEGTSVYYSQASGTGPYLDATIVDAGSTASTFESVEVQAFVMSRR